MQIFADDNLANSLSENAIAKAEVWHDREKNTQDYLDMYYKIYND